MFIKLIFALLFVCNALCAVRDAAPEINRRLLGSNGPFRDFQASDCDEPVQHYSRCTDEQFVWHWNNRLQGCERVIWKGCEATRNNFITEKNCQDQATKVCTKTRKH